MKSHKQMAPQQIVARSASSSASAASSSSNSRRRVAVLLRSVGLLVGELTDKKNVFCLHTLLSLTLLH